MSALIIFILYFRTKDFNTMILPCRGPEHCSLRSQKPQTAVYSFSDVRVLFPVLRYFRRNIVTHQHRNRFFSRSMTMGGTSGSRCQFDGSTITPQPSMLETSFWKQVPVPAFLHYGTCSDDAADARVPERFSSTPTITPDSHGIQTTVIFLGLDPVDFYRGSSVLRLP